MTIRRNRKTKDWLLFCDAVRCVEREEFPSSTPFHAILRWWKRHGWVARQMPGADRWTHTCESCECRRKGLPDNFRERLHGT